MFSRIACGARTRVLVPQLQQLPWNISACHNVCVRSHSHSHSHSHLRSLSTAAAYARAATAKHIKDVAIEHQQQHPTSANSPSLAHHLLAPVITIPEQPTPAQIQTFLTDGFITVSSIVSRDVCEAISQRVDTCFRGDFDTYNYPDEWYWRVEMSKPDVTRHMCNIWKSDRGVAQLLLNEKIARFAHALMSAAQRASSGTDVAGIRIGNDSVWVKPPSSTLSFVSYHRDSMYVPFAPSLTAWITLTDVGKFNGTLEYIPGSHKWETVNALPRDEFHAVETGYRHSATLAAKRAGVDPSTIRYHELELPAGSIVFHHGDMWHGSAPNPSTTQWRRSIAVHYIPEESTFKDGHHTGYIYGRYQKYGHSSLDEAFFPILHSQHTQRSTFLNEFLNMTDYPKKHD